jgi:hypothetical protein
VVKLSPAEIAKLPSDASRYHILESSTDKASHDAAFHNGPFFMLSSKHDATAIVIRGGIQIGSNGANMVLNSARLEGVS